MDGKWSTSLSQLNAWSNASEVRIHHQSNSHLPLNGGLAPHPGHRLYTPQPPKRNPLKPPASTKPLFAQDSPTAPRLKVPGKSHGLKLKFPDRDESVRNDSDRDSQSSSIYNGNVGESPTTRRAIKPSKAQFKSDSHQLSGNGTVSKSGGSVITPGTPETVKESKSQKNEQLQPKRKLLEPPSLSKLDVLPSTGNSPTRRHPQHDKKSPFGSLASVSKSLVASNEILNDIFLSDRGTHKKLKAVVGFLVGVILGVLLFIGLYYGLAYGLYLALIITAISTIFMSLCLALTVRFRCVAVLMIPTGCTSRGRAAFLAFIVALLLRGPVHNIFVNANEVSDSMSCSAELVYNQSSEIQEVALRILDAYVGAIQDAIGDTQDALEQVRMTFEPLENGLRTASRRLDSAKRELQRANEACNRVIGEARNSCVRELDGVYSRCQQYLGRSLVLGSAGQICTPFMLSGACRPLDIGIICEAPASIDDAVSDVLSDVRSNLQRVAGAFNAGVDFSRYYDRRLNSSTTAEHIQETIQEKLHHAYSYVELVLLYSDKILALSFVWLCIKSYMYHSSYRTKDSFDNQYITAQFKKLDASRKERGVRSVLPLKKNERTRLIDVTSLRLCQSEKGYFKFGLSTVIFHSIIAGVVLAVDFGLYWLLKTIQENGDVLIEASGELGSDVTIDGNGILADFFRLFISQGFQAMTAFNATLDTTICLPQPVEPNSWLALTIGILYLGTILMVLSQAYAQRLLRYIAAYYYPEREEERIAYLYDRTLRKRETLLSVLRDKVRNNKKEQDASNRISISAYLMRKYPCCKGLLTMCGAKQRQCLGCLSADDGLRVYCSDQDCEGMYCEECARALNGTCSVCDDNIDMGKLKLGTM